MKESISKEEKKELYVNPNEFWDGIRAYYNDESDKWPESLGIMLTKIANKMRWLHNFKEYPYIDEMISDAKVKMIEVLLDKKFNLYSYTPLSKDNYKSTPDGYHIREYKRGSDQRGKIDGGKNERGMIIFTPDGEFRPLCREQEASEELIIEKRGLEIYHGDELLCRLKPDDMRKYDEWNGLCLRTRNIAFGYFSQTCKNCYIARIKKEKQNEQMKLDIREKTWNEVGDMGEGWDKIRAPRGNDDEDEFYNYE